MNEYIVNEITHLVNEIWEIKYAKKHNILRAILRYVKRKKIEIEKNDKAVKNKLTKVRSKGKVYGYKY